MRIRYHFIANLHTTETRSMPLLTRYDKNNIIGWAKRHSKTGFSVNDWIACSRLSVSVDDWKSGRATRGSGREGRCDALPFSLPDPARSWSRLSPARFFDRPHWLRAWNRLTIEHQAKHCTNWSGLLDKLWFQVGVNFFQSEKASVQITAVAKLTVSV